MIDLAVAYRIYPGISKTPAFFSGDKFKLSELCLRSFKRALGPLRVKLWALLDGCPPEYELLFRDVFANDQLEIIALDKVGNLATFGLQLRLLTQQSEAPYVYFAEDDYFYLDDALSKMLSFLRGNQDADFVSTYDHPDSYYTSSRFERHSVRPFGDRYWRTASSTCLTFLTSRDNLIRTQSIFDTYTHGSMDCPIWLALTQKLGLADPRVHWHDQFRRRTWAKTWLWGYRRILFHRAQRLWVPLPALGTHIESSCLSPLVDWNEAFLRSQEQLHQR